MNHGEYVGRMAVGACPKCDGAVALMWLDEGIPEKEVKQTIGDWYLRGLKIHTLNRYEGDPMPEYCARFAPLQTDNL